ncbi:MAG TPA: 16S rRNA (cytidine(1402)-2'-O)-methyltransferase [Candidatus Limnocylindrales bacterium]
MTATAAVHPATSAGAGGDLYVVATPIGNLGDVTLRALEVLRAVPLIACEDTRITRRLLARHAIDARLTAFHAHSGPGKLEVLLRHLASGQDLALTTDAGTPGVSDPGEELVAAWAAAGGRVVPIPGASAALAAVMAAGIAGPRWVFEGFLPRSGRERRSRLAALAADHRASIVYEAPNRLAATLADLAAACGDGRPGAVCRELTKVHESIVRGSLAELAASAAAGGIPARGEMVVVVGAASTGVGDASPTIAPTPDLAAGRAEVAALVAAGHARAAAARAVASRTGLPRRQLYEAGLGEPPNARLPAARGRSAPPE